MKFSLLAAVSICLSVLSFAAQTEIRDGFEEIAVTVKSQDKYYMKHIRNGWDFGKGPVIFHPARWLPNIGKNGRFMSIDCSEDDRMGPFVHSGNGSLRVGVVGGKGSVHVLCRTSVVPGRYRLSAWTRGNGKLNFVAYVYFAPGDSRIVTKQLGCATQPSDEWRHVEASVSCGADEARAKSVTLAFVVSGGDVYLDDLVLVPDDGKGEDRR